MTTSKPYTSFNDKLGNNYSFANYMDFASFWFNLSRKNAISFFPENFKLLQAAATTSKEAKTKVMQLNSVKVLFNNTEYNYQTSVSATATKESVTHYFVGKKFNLGAYPVEDMQVCTGIEFTNNN